MLNIVSDTPDIEIKLNMHVTTGLILSLMQAIHFMSSRIGPIICMGGSG